MIEVKVHTANPSAPRGSNANNGWIVRIQRGRLRRLDYGIN
ncbi:MAG: hypothetical protein K6G88_06115 [Lachnospiraceae bacterium]|nr:hypothetical protein [Lachnospiraceae bacterium]